VNAAGIGTDSLSIFRIKPDDEKSAVCTDDALKYQPCPFSDGKEGLVVDLQERA
jgi:hypothetical protein